MTKRSMVRAAKARGLISKATAESAAPTRHRRVCVACGHTFRADGLRNFCNCGCCANAWGVLYERERANPPEPGEGFRWMRVGDRVIRRADGHAGILRRVPQSGENGAGVVEIDGELLTVSPRDVEKVLGLKVEHACGKDRNPFARTVAKKGAEDGEPTSDE